MNLKPGTLLQGDKYRIIRALGSGGFGITYLAEQVMAERKVCIKEFFPAEYYNRDANGCSISLGSQGSAKIMEAFKAKFIKEAKTIAKFDHANIIHIHDVFAENNTAYYVMEYIDGESLSSVVKRHDALNEATAVSYIRQVAEALDYIHEQRIMHLDVKPGNVMLRSRDERAILIDFGLSKHYDAESGEATSSSPVGVSHGFAPMEQYKSDGVREFSPSTDIYSLGATLYYLVTGSVPPEAADVSDDGLPPLPAHLSQGVRTAIERSMADKRKARPQSIREFLALLDDNQPVAAPVAQPAAEVTVVNVETKKISEATVISVETPVERSTPKSEPKSTSIPTPAPSPKRGVGRWLWLVLIAVVVVVGLVVVGGDDEDVKPEAVVEVENYATESEPTYGIDFTETIGGVSFKMIWVEGGTFKMGSPGGDDMVCYLDDDGGYPHEQPQHDVTLDGYWIAETEVTQGLWRAVMGTTVEQQLNKKHTTRPLRGVSDKHPMYWVSFKEALAFCDELNKKTKYKYNFTLPTEAQWEYAARGGKKSKNFKYSGSDNIDEVAWYGEYHEGKTHEVKGKTPNELGLYDMSGNLWEWCLDWYSNSYPKEAQNNPSGPSNGTCHVVRGGSWFYNATNCRVSSRNSNRPDHSIDDFGFRIVALPK